MALIEIINILIIFNLSYWGFYFLVNFFYKIGRIEILIVYLIVGLAIGLFTTKENGSWRVKKWNKLMDKLDSKNNPSKHKVMFIRMIGWPVGIIIMIYNFLRKINYRK